MAITVNGDPHPHRDGLTVEELLDELRFTYPLKTVLVDGRRVPRDAYAGTVLDDGAEVKVLHLMAGG
jgi:sulfur carrier protein